MKNKIASAVLLALVIALQAGCSHVLKPSSESFAEMKVVQFGEEVPEEEEFVLFFPKGEPIPLRVLIRGDLFSEGADKTVYARLDRDVYAYKRWISFDKETWQDGDELVDSQLEIGIPSYQHPKTGLIDLKMDVKHPSA